MKDVVKLTENDIHDLYNYHLRNKVFSVERDLQNLYDLFHMIAKEKILLLDKYTNISTQFRLCLTELEHLQIAVSKIYEDFETEEQIADYKKRGLR